MMERICVYAGSFDPVTVGHEDIIRRAAKLCDKLLVTVMHNPAKKSSFTVAERLIMLSRVTEGIPNVQVDAWNGLMVDYVRQKGAAFVVRGLRGFSDFENEANLAQVNKRLMPELETIFLMAQPEHACISSSVVREAAMFGADFRSFVPACVLADVMARFTKQN